VGTDSSPVSTAAYAIGAGPASHPTINLSFTTSSGNHIQLDNLLPASISRTVEISGTNAATQMLASTMTQLSAQLLAAGEISPKQHSALNALANQGHEIAQIEALIETAASQNYPGTPQEQTRAFLSQVVQYNGKPVTIQALSQQIGYQQTPRQGDAQKDSSATNLIYGVMPADPLHPNNGPYPATMEFLKLYGNLENSGALNNLQVKEIVTSLSLQIATLGEVAHQTTGAVITGSESIHGLPNLEANVLSHTKTQSICGTGGVNDNGIHCGS